jgi:hypothetical protein
LIPLPLQSITLPLQGVALLLEITNLLFDAITLLSVATVASAPSPKASVSRTVDRGLAGAFRQPPLLPSIR